MWAYAIIQDSYGKKYQYKCDDHDAIYDRVVTIIDNIQEAIEIASWCELASVGERFLGDGVTVNICEV